MSAAAFVGVGVGLGVLVALRAVRDGATIGCRCRDATCALFARESWVLAAPEVLALRHDLEVIGVPTAGIAAQMVDDESFGDRVDQQFVSEAVHVLGFAAALAAWADHSVAVRGVR